MVAAAQVKSLVEASNAHHYPSLSTPQLRVDSVEAHFDWKAKSLLGCGAFGTVYGTACTQVLKEQGKADQDHQGSFGVLVVGQTYAIKVIAKATLDTAHKVLGIVREIETLKVLQSVRYCVHLYDCFQDEINIYLVMEYIPGCELLEFINARGRLSEADSKVVVRQLVEALNEIHAHHVVHRDLKLENVLIHPDTLEIKIIDLGCAKRFSVADVTKPERRPKKFYLDMLRKLMPLRTRKNSLTSEEYSSPLRPPTAQSTLSNTFGTEIYYPGEVLRAMNSYSATAMKLWQGETEVQKRDMFALGVITYAMLGGIMPFYFSSLDEHIAQIDQGPSFPAECFAEVSIEAKDFCLQLLHSNPFQRLRGGDAFANAWLKGTKSAVKNSDAEAIHVPPAGDVILTVQLGSDLTGQSTASAEFQQQQRGVSRVVGGGQVKEVEAAKAKKAPSKVKGGCCVLFGLEMMLTAKWGSKHNVPKP